MSKIIELKGKADSVSLVSEISFQNKDFIKGLNLMFGVDDKEEEIVAIEIKDNSIVAKFRTLK